MEYNRVNWKDYPDTTTKLNAENLNKMDEGIAAAKEAIDEINSNLESLSSFYVDANSQLLTISGIDSGAIQITPPQRDGYEVVAAIIRTTSGENSSYLVANITTSGWLSCCNCKNITVDVVFTVRFFYRKKKQ